MRTRLAAFLSDLHLGTHHQAAYKLVLNILDDHDCDDFILGGDCFDPTAISHWTTEPAEKRLFSKQVADMRSEIERLASKFNGKLYYLEGNHEIHVRKFLHSHAAELDDFDELQIPRLLRLKEHGFTYLSEREPLFLGDLKVMHGHQFFRKNFSGDFPAKKIFLKQFRDILIGHVHRIGVYRHTIDSGKIIRAYTNGTLQDRRKIDFDYGPNWHMGISFIEYSQSGFYHVEQIEILEDGDRLRAKAMGKLYDVKNG